MGTSRSRYEYYISRPIINNNFLLSFYSIVIDLEMHRDIYMHPTRSKA